MTREEALAKLEETVKAAGPFVMATVDEARAPQMRWMGAAIRDTQNALLYYLVCGSSSRKMAQIAQNPATQLMFHTEGFQCIVTVSGKSQAVDSAGLKHSIWEQTPVLARYYAGPDDPRFALIGFEVECLEILCIGGSHEPVRVSFCD